MDFKKINIDKLPKEIKEVFLDVKDMTDNFDSEVMSLMTEEISDLKSILIEYPEAITPVKPKETKTKIVGRPTNMSQLKKWLKQNIGKAIYAVKTPNPKDVGAPRTISTVQTNAVMFITKHGEAWLDYPKASNITFSKVGFEINGKLSYVYDKKDIPSEEPKKRNLSKSAQKTLARLKKQNKLKSQTENRKDSDIIRDAGRPAAKAGKRISKNGKVYYENRPNRTDVDPKGTMLKSGGSIPSESDADKLVKNWLAMDIENPGKQESSLHEYASINSLQENNIWASFEKATKNMSSNEKGQHAAALEQLLAEEFEFKNGGSMASGGGVDDYEWDEDDTFEMGYKALYEYAKKHNIAEKDIEAYVVAVAPNPDARRSFDEDNINEIWEWILSNGLWDMIDYDDIADPYEDDFPDKLKVWLSKQKPSEIKAKIKHLKDNIPNTEDDPGDSSWYKSGGKVDGKFTFIPFKHSYFDSYKTEAVYSNDEFIGWMNKYDNDDDDYGFWGVELDSNQTPKQFIEQGADVIETEGWSVRGTKKEVLDEITTIYKKGGNVNEDRSRDLKFQSKEPHEIRYAKRKNLKRRKYNKKKK